MDEQRVLGRIETLQEWMKEEIDELKKEVRILNQFKWRVAGGAAVFSVLLSVGMSFLIETISHHN